MLSYSFKDGGRRANRSWQTKADQAPVSRIRPAGLNVLLHLVIITMDIISATSPLCFQYSSIKNVVANIDHVSVFPQG